MAVASSQLRKPDARGPARNWAWCRPMTPLPRSPRRCGKSHLSLRFGVRSAQNQCAGPSVLT